MATTTLTTDPDLFVGTGADDTVNGLSTTLNAGDSLDGAGGHDTLQLFGSGTFDLAALTQFAGFEEVTVTNITGGQSNLTLRDGVDLTVNVDNPSGYGGTVNLGDGTTTLNLGSSHSYTVNASTGTVTINSSGSNGRYNLSSGDATITSSNGGRFQLSSGAATLDVGGGYAVFYLSTGVANISYHGNDSSEVFYLLVKQ